MLKKSLALLLAMLMVITAIPFTAFATEETESVSDVTIGSEADLRNFADSVNNGNTYAGITVKLTADIALTGEWTPIGEGTRSGSSYSGTPFKGIFDGGDHTISGLTITSTTGTDAALGLFGVVDGGTVKNLNLTYVSIAVSSSECAGGAIGVLTGGGVADKITVSGSVSAKRGNGGIVGRMLVSGTISNCVNNATMAATGGANLGGIVGAAYYTAEGKVMNITNCTNNGNVTGAAGGVGGIVGLSTGKVTGCTNNGAVSGANASVGGIVGEQQNYGEVSNNTNSADVVNNTGSGVYGTGGIIGWVRYNGTAANYPLKGIISVTGNNNSGSVTGGNDAGGIVGTVYNAATVTGNTNTADKLVSVNFGAGIVANIQFTETPIQGTSSDSVIIPEKTATVTNNTSTTALENMTASCKGLYVYDNSSGSQNGETEEGNTNPTGTVTLAYTSETTIWGEATGNASESFAIRLYSGDTLLVTATLNDPTNVIIDGNIENVTWNIPVNSAGNDSWWTVEWVKYITADVQPTKVVVVVDGVEVAENNYKLNGPDEIDKIYAASVDADGKILAYHTTLVAAIENGENVVLLRDVVLTDTLTVPAGKTVVLDLNGKTMTYNGTTQGEAMITNKGNLTINDTVGTGVINYNYTGEADSTHSKGNYTISNGGTLTVNGGKITIANLRGHAKYPIDNNSTTGDAILVINGGHLYNYNTSAIRQFCNSTTNKNSVTINGGLIEGYCAIWVQNPGSNTVNGSLSITGGEIKTTAAAYVANPTPETLKNVSSGIYCTTEGGAWDDASAVSITGGIINENVDLAEEAPASITVAETGVTFNGKVELPATPGLSGSGTEADPYLISNLDDLVWFRNDVNAGNTYEGEYVKLTADIDLEGYTEMNVNYQGNNVSASTFRPIGDYSCNASFKGTFDGDNHTISNLYINGWDINYCWGKYGSAGLFGTIDNATIKNLTVSGFEIQVEGGDVAAIAGHAKGICTFENITVTDSKIATYNNGCAGIVAWSEAGAYTFKDIDITGSVVLAGLWGSFDSSIGGVVGQADNNATYLFEDVTVACRLDCYNDVTAAYKYYAYRMCGMLIGRIPVDANNQPILNNVTIGNNVEIDYSNTPDYTYTNATGSWKRVEAGYTYDGVDLTQYPDAEVIYKPFNSMFGGQQYGSYGQDDHEDIETSGRVAAFEGDYFTSLETAIKAADGAEDSEGNAIPVKLLANCDKDIVITESLKLDLNGYSFTGNVTTVDGKKVVFEDGKYTTVIVANNQAELQAALDNCKPGTTIELVAGVNYGTVYLRPNPNNPATKEVDWVGNNYHYESYTCFEDLTIKGAEGAIIDVIKIEGGTYYNTAHSQAATYPVMLSLIELKNVTIEGVTFTGNGGQYGDAHGNAISMAGSNIKVDGLTLKNCVLQDSTNNNRLLYKSEATGKHTYTYNGETYTFVADQKNITVTGCTFNGGYMGMELRETENITITNNTFNGVSSRDILLTPNGGCTFSGKIIITGNTSNGAGNRFVRASGIGNAELTISDNTINNYAGPDADFIKADGVTGDVTIANNTFDGEVIAVTEENGTYRVIVPTYVASVNGVKYTDLQDAINAAQNGDTITLLADIAIDSETYTIADGTSLTLDMNGKKITVTDNKTSNYELFYIYGELTVTGNGTIELTSTNDRDWNAMSAIFHNRGGVLTIENGTYTHNGGTDMAWVVDNSGNWYGDATTNIKGGTLTSTYTAIRNRMEQNSHGASGKAILNISGGKITGTTSAIWAQAASTSTTAPATGEINISGGEIGNINTARSEGAVSMTTISGGTVDAFKGEVGELTVTGGTLKEVTMLTAAGEATDYAVTSDGKYVAAVAKIGDVRYATLEEAFAAAADGETITLVNDVKLTESVVISGKTLTLNLGEFTIEDKCTTVLNSTSDVWGLVELKNNAKLTVKADNDGTIKCNYTVVSGGWTGMAYAINVDATSELIVEGGAFINGNGGIQALGTVTVNDGTFVSHNGGTCIMALGATANVTITGGVFKDSVEEDDDYTGSGAVWGGFGATIAINGGTYDFEADPSNNNIVWTLFPAQNAISSTGENANMTVTGGTFVNFNPAEDVVVDYDASTGFTFGSVVAEGYKVVDNGNETYGVAEDPAYGKVAKIGDNYYATLAEAIAAAKAGNTITLLADITASEIITIDKAITLDGNGHTLTYTGTNRAIDIPNNAGANIDASIKNLTIDCTASYCERGINFNEGSGKLSLDTVTIKGTNLTYALNLPGDSDGAEITIADSSFTANIALNIWGENVTVNATDSDFVSVDAAEHEDYVAIAVNNDGEITAAGTVVNVTGGSIIAYKEDGTTPSDAIRIATTATVNVSDSTEVVGTIEKPVAVIHYGTSHYTYSTLAEAINAAVAGDTIVLLTDITASEIITIDKAITLDGNGKTITSTAARAINVSGANGVTIKNLTIECTGERAINIIQNATNVTIDNVTATANNYTVNVAISAGEAQVAITNSNLTGACTVNVSGAGADVTIDNSTVNCVDNNTAVGESYAALSLNREAAGGSIVATNTTVNVTVGSDSNKGRNGAENGTVTINGSTEDVISIVAVITYEGSSTYHGFTSIEDAIEYAKAGDTITLIRDITSSEIITINKAITLDGNGKTLTSTAGRGINVDCNGDVTIKNLTIVASGERAINVINKPANLTIDKVTATAAGYTINVAGTASTAIITIKDSEFTGCIALNLWGENVTVNATDSDFISVDNSAVEDYTAIALNNDGTTAATGTVVNVTGGSVIARKEDGTTPSVAVRDAVNATVSISSTTEVVGSIKQPVAMINYGANQYMCYTLQDAIERATAGDTIVLLKDITASEIIVIDKAITLNGNGYTLTSTAGRAINVDCNGDVTIKNLTIAASGERAINVINKPANLTIDNVTATAAGYTINVAGTASNAKITINGSEFTGCIALNIWGENVTVDATDSDFISVDYSADEDYAAIALNNDGTTAATGTEININGGSVIACKEDGTTPSVAVRDAVNATLNINDATVVGEIKQPVAVINYGANQYMCYTLQDAIERAAAGDTITLIRDITASEIIVIDKAITLDGNGKTLASAAGRAINVSGADGVTIKNLTIECTGERAINIIQGATNVTIDNVTIDANNYAVNVASSAPNAVVTIKNSDLTGLNVVNVAGAGAEVTVTNTELTNDNTDENQAFAVLNLNKDAVGGTITANGCTFTCGLNTVNGRNDAENGTITIDGSTDGVAVTVAYINYGSYYAPYTSLAKAIAAAKAGNTVTLIRDFTESGIKLAGKAITLDLNGKTVSGTCNSSEAYLIQVANDASLTVKDSASGGKLTFAQGSSNVGYTVDVKGKFILESGTIELTGSWSIGFAVNARPNAWESAYTNPTVFTMNGGSVISSDSAIRLGSSSSENHTDMGVSFVMNGGYIDAAWDGVFVQQENTNYDKYSVTINGGTIESDIAPIRIYGEAATSAAEDSMDINILGGTLTYTGTESYTWIINGIFRSTGAEISEHLDYADVTVSSAIATSATLADGFKWVENTDGTYSVAKCNYVAEVNGVKYETLQAAINAAQAGKTIVVLDDIILTETLEIAADDEITLDLNGYAINADLDAGSTTKHLYAFKNYGTLTIKDSVGGGSINSRGTYNYGTLTLESGAINAIDGNGGYAVWNQSGSTFTMNGGTVAATYEDDNLVDLGGYDATAIRVEEGATATINGGIINNVSDFTFAVDNSGTVTITGGTITSVHTTVRNNGTMTITGGTFTCKGVDGETQHVIWAEAGTTTVTGGTFDGKDTYNGFNVTASAGATVNITGGNFLSVHSGSLYGEGTIAVSGGTFFDAVPADRCAEGYIPTANADGTYGVAEDPAYGKVAKIGDTYYETLAEALAAAKSGDTIKLVADHSESVVMLNKGVTLDLNGYQLTAGYVIAFNGNHIVDSSDGKTGRLVCAANCISLAKNNVQLPVLTNDGYVFVDPDIVVQEAIIGATTSLTFKPNFGTSINPLFADGMKNNAISVYIRVEWNGGNQEFIYSEDIIKTVYSSKTGFSCTINNLNKYENVSVSIVLGAEMGVVYYGKTYSVQ